MFMTAPGDFEVIPAELTEDDDAVNTRLLLQGFEAFNQATLKLQAYYRGLEEKVDELHHQLEQKNRELEQNLLEKERVTNYLTNIFESSAIGIIVTDLDGIITSINQRGLRLLGTIQEHTSGKYLNDFFQSPVLPWELTLPGLATYEKVEEQEVDFFRADGVKLRLLLSISLMYSEHNHILGLIVNVQDITAMKKLEAQVERKNRFAVMGEMAAIIAHEIRNPLGSIELFASLLKQDLPSEAPQQSLLEHITSAIHSMNHIISNLLEYTKSRAIVSWEKIDLHEFLRQLLAFSRHLMEQNRIELQTDFGARQTLVQGDRELLKQIFHNLVNNAIQAMADSGTLTIRTRNIHTSNKKLLKRFRSFLGKKESLHLIEVCIQDSGVGMTAEVKKKIFYPFFTTKERGTGLGLAVVHNLVEAHGAVIDVESEVNQGTQMTLLFPVIHEEVS